MSDFMKEARAAAAREYGARHYRTFAFWYMLRRWAALLGAVAVLCAVVGGGWAVWSRWPQWVPGIVAVLAVLIIGSITALIARAWRNRW